MAREVVDVLTASVFPVRKEAASRAESKGTSIYQPFLCPGPELESSQWMLTAHAGHLFPNLRSIPLQGITFVQNYF